MTGISIKCVGQNFGNPSGAIKITKRVGGIWADLSGNKFPAKLLTLQSPGGLLRAMNTDSKVLFHENTEFITYHSNSRKML
jgi:hypothetical protein